jgi:hypothetical protein
LQATCKVDTLVASVVSFVGVIRRSPVRNRIKETMMSKGDHDE